MSRSKDRIACPVQPGEVLDSWRQPKESWRRPNGAHGATGPLGPWATRTPYVYNLAHSFPGFFQVRHLIAPIFIIARRVCSANRHLLRSRWGVRRQVGVGVLGPREGNRWTTPWKNILTSRLGAKKTTHFAFCISQAQDPSASQSRQTRPRVPTAFTASVTYRRGVR